MPLLIVITLIYKIVVTIDIDPHSSTETIKSTSKESSDTTLTLITVLQNKHDRKHTKDTATNPSSSIIADSNVMLTAVSNKNFEVSIHLLPESRMIAMIQTNQSDTHFLSGIVCLNKLMIIF